jgi:uncharacterized protein YbjT (DUF2867 family)
MKTNQILVTGSTGYVGGRLVNRLLTSGYHVKVAGRSIDKIKSRPWAKNSRVELVQADLLEYSSLEKALKNCRAAYYLVHSMNPQSRDFAESDRIAALNMVKAAEKNKLEKIIYLSGLGEKDSGLSKHLKSRAEVAEILVSGSVPVTVLRAAMILGSGSASFEILRYLVERLPVMVTPRWVHNPVQPIAIRNVLQYLEGCLENDETKGRVFDIGGPDILTYGRLMKLYAEEAGIKHRFIIPVPVLSPRLSSYWINLVTPVPAFIAKPLAEGLRNPVVCRESEIERLIPQELIDCRTAIHLALGRARDNCIESCWSDSGFIDVPEWLQCGDAPYAGGSLKEAGYAVSFKGVTREEVWNRLIRIGGETGYFYGSFLWKLRGFIDRMVGGAGLNRGRRHPVELGEGDALDFFRVLNMRAPILLRLFSEMKLPGEAILEFHIIIKTDETVELRMIARYSPRGLAGLLYWYLVYPFHNIVFKGMLKNIVLSINRSLKPDDFKIYPFHMDECVHEQL